LTRSGEGSVSLTDAERSALVDSLRRHLIDQRIDLDDFERRLDALNRSRTRAEADTVFADLPLLAGTAATRRRRRRRHGHADTPAPTWRPTHEVFRDPASGRLTRVWVDPLDGSRHYLAD